MVTDAQIKAQKKYDAENTRQVHMKLNRRTDEDALGKLDSVPPATSSNQKSAWERCLGDVARGVRGDG